ncbi:alpha/beta hydrolase, partial [Aquisalimonas sp.]|uniref:alpha/beta hydrolase n=1 Tax=Aquisalimonas sp. TaxID=1872621 RepID=UPI0025C63B4D
MLGFFAFGALAPVEQPKLEVIHRPPSTTRRRGVPPLLFVHGAYAGAWCWDEHFLPWFAAHGFDAYALSLRGHGASQGGEQLQQSSIRDYVADLRHVVEGMETPPVLIGHSMGGMVVQKYLEQFPASAAVLMASVPPGGLGSSIMRLATADPLVFTRMSMVQGGGLDPVDKDNAVRSILPQDLDPEVETAYSTRMLSESQR